MAKFVMRKRHKGESFEDFRERRKVCNAKRRKREKRPKGEILP